MKLFQLLKAIIGAESSKGPKRYWLFYAGPENYLYEGGIRDLPIESFWSCESETREGDLILVYRKSKNQLTIEALMNNFGMSRDTANKVAKTNIGKDFPVIWQATSNSKRQSSWHWPYGCGVREVRKISPPIQLEQLKAIPPTEEMGRSMFQSTGKRTQRDRDTGLRLGDHQQYYR